MVANIIKVIFQWLGKGFSEGIFFLSQIHTVCNNLITYLLFYTISLRDNESNLSLFQFSLKVQTQKGLSMNLLMTRETDLCSR